LRSEPTPALGPGADLSRPPSEGLESADIVAKVF
jgi:hypothetical protein